MSQAVSSNEKAHFSGAAGRFARTLRAGSVYRREDLAHLTTAVDRHLQQLVSGGRLKKLAQGLYYAPRLSRLGPLPPDDSEIVRGFLRDPDFLVFSPSAYNTLGLGTTRLYNRTWVYNRKRHGLFRLGNREFDFRVKQRFPKKLSLEFLYVDLLNNLGELSENRDEVLERARQKLDSFDCARLRRAVDRYASVATRKQFESWGAYDDVFARTA